MGKIKYLNNIRKFFKESPVVNINSLKKFIKGKDKRYVYLIISNLLKKKEVNKITKGYYSIYDEPSLIVFCLKPSYLGLQNALSFHKLWDQNTVPSVITTRNIRQGIRRVFGMNVMARRLDKKYLFGFEYYKSGDFYFPYSDIEKTFIDMVYFSQPLDKETIAEFKKKINKKKLVSYLRSYPKIFQEKVKKIMRM